MPILRIPKPQTLNQSLCFGKPLTCGSGKILPVVKHVSNVGIRAHACQDPKTEPEFRGALCARAASNLHTEKVARPLSGSMLGNFTMTYQNMDAYYKMRGSYHISTWPDMVQNRFPNPSS